MTHHTTHRHIRRKRYRSDFLFAKGSILLGMGNVLTIAGRYHGFNYSESGEEADFKAIESDFGVIGQDITDAMSVMPPEKWLTKK